MNSAQAEQIFIPHKLVSSFNIFLLKWLQRLALVSFGLGIITLPWRLVLWRWKRPFPPIYADFTDFLLMPQDVFLSITLLLWGICLAVKPRRLLTGPWFIWIPIVGLTIVSWISVPMSVDLPLSIYHAIRLLMLLGLYLYVVNELGGKWLAPSKVWRPFRAMWTVTIPLAIQIGIQAIIGIGQWRQQTDLGWQWLGEQSLSYETSNIVWAAGGKQAIKAYGLADHPNILAMNLTVGLLLLLAIVVSSRDKMRRWLLPIFAGGTAVLIVTFFRPAWIAFVAGIALFIWMASKNGQKSISQHIRPYIWTIFATFLIPFLIILPFIKLDADEALIAARIHERVVTQQQGKILTIAANEIFTQHATVGTGIGTLPLSIQQSFPEFETHYQPTRINFINVAAELGLFGALFYGLLLTMPWLMLFINRNRIYLMARQENDHSQFAPFLFLAAMSAALLAITILSFSDAYAWFYPAGRFWQWFLWGLWGISYNEYSNKYQTLLQKTQPIKKDIYV